MLSQGHMGAPWCSCHYSSQVGPRFGKRASLVEWEWCHSVWGWYPPLITSYIYKRHIQSAWAIAMLSQGHMCAPLHQSTDQVVPRIGNSGSLVEWKWCHYIMFEADIHLTPLQTSILDIPKVFEPLVCCLKGIWVHPYAIILTKLAPDLGILGHFWKGIDVIMSCLELISTSDHFKHQHQKYKVF